MRKRVAVCAGLLIALIGSAAGQQNDRIQLRLDTSEVKAVLAILDKRASHEAVTEADCQAVFATTPFQRLKARTEAFHGRLTQEDFQRFVATLDAKRAAFHQALTAWEKADLHAAAERTLRYLPATAVIKASVFPVIKPQTNSFVFQPSTDPAIFLYFDPETPVAQFENT